MRHVGRVAGALPFGRSGSFRNDCAVHHLTTPKAWIWDRSPTGPSFCSDMWPFCLLRNRPLHFG
jgi:hypothetical protein